MEAKVSTGAGAITSGSVRITTCRELTSDTPLETGSSAGGCDILLGSDPCGAWLESADTSGCDCEVDSGRSCCNETDKSGFIGASSSLL